MLPFVQSSNKPYLLFNIYRVNTQRIQQQKSIELQLNQTNCPNIWIFDFYLGYWKARALERARLSLSLEFSVKKTNTRYFWRGLKGVLVVKRLKERRYYPFFKYIVMEKINFSQAYIFSDSKRVKKDNCRLVQGKN